MHSKKYEMPLEFSALGWGGDPQSFIEESLPSGFATGQTQDSVEHSMSESSVSDYRVSHWEDSVVIEL